MKKRTNGTKRASRAREAIDNDAARELELYIENTYDLVAEPNSVGKNIEANLTRRVSKGTFDAQKSVRLWLYLIDEGAQRYAKEFGSAGGRDWHKMFNKPTREFVAGRFAEEFQREHVK